MELNQIRYFITLCGTLNFTRAAELCNVTQPAFTRAIQRLEHEFGGVLLLRERNLTQLTELGRIVRPHLEAMLEAADVARKLAHDAGRHKPASLRIGLASGIAAVPVAGSIQEIAAKFSDLAIELEEAPAPVLTEAMLSGRIDCALMCLDGSQPERLNRWKLYDETAAVILPRDHAAAARPELTPADLLDDVWLHDDDELSFTGQLFRHGKMNFRKRKCTAAPARMLDLIAAGFGISLMPAQMALPRTVVAIKLARPCLSRGIYLTAIAGRPLNAAASGFIKLCRARAFG